MGKYYVPKDISCKKKDCFANVKETCSILCDTNFGKRECPFFKPKRRQSMKIKCPICGKDAKVNYCNEVVGEFMENWFEMEIGCGHCKSVILIRTFSRKHLDEFLQKSKV